MLLGENGAGKSTLMKILSGVYARDEGRIFIDGQEIEPRNARHAQTLGISIIYQTFSQAPHLNVAENLFLGREPLTPWGTIDARRTRAMSRDALARVGLDLDPQTPIKKLSVAQRQMLEIAKALTLDAKIVIMDEPTSALTDRETRRLFQIIGALKAEGRAIIYISHRLEEVAEIGDRVTVLRDGRKVGSADVATVAVPTLISMMVGRDLVLTALRETAAPGKEVLRVEGLSRKGVLTDIDLRLHQGEIVALAGLVGSGRTELARAIFGADPIDAGQIRVDGKPVRIRHPADAAKLGIGFVTEDRLQSGLLMTMSIVHNATLPSLRQFGSARRAVLERGRRARRRRASRAPAQGPESLARSQGALPERRQSAEGGAGQVADGALQHPDHGRAHAGHRRGRQRGRPPADGGLHPQGRRRHPPDLVGPAGSAAHERSDPGDARGQHRG